MPIWSASALEGRNSFGSPQVTQVAIPDARQIDRIGPWSRSVATVLASGPE